MNTKQEKFWSGQFGQEYTNRNTHDIKEWNKFYTDTWGVSRLSMNEKSIGHLSKEIKILEIGCNTGMQLRGLQHLGFKNLYGVEVQHFATEEAKSHTKNINIIQGSGFDLPFKDGYFDLVFTSGVLIHIAPENHSKIIDEMYRCSSQYIWGWEYYSKDIQSINYRGNDGFLWKADFAQIIMDKYPDLQLVSSQDYPYITDADKGNVDRMYLLEKK